MAIHTQESLSGFIASTPLLTFTSKGEARFYARVGQEHYVRNDDSSFTQDDTSFHDLGMYRRSAERAYEQFAKGDNFIAEGYTHAFSYEKDRRTVTREEFVAKRLGHDVARSSYNVDRTRRHATGVEQTAEQSATPSIEPTPSAAARPDPTIAL